ncbi:MAG: carboxypeptidase-like regulatory domain-containing protein, partial [bacterium]|nr:carboxypeptidase-like regulatory domain-containing protein [bacterium]
MKLSMLMLVCSAGIAWSAESYAQEAKVSLNAQNETVQTVLSKIEDQSEFSFFFNVRHIDLDRRVSLQAEKSDVFVVLDQLFAGTDVTYKVLDRKIILTKVEASQQNGRRVTGKVLDKNGEPIIGANVVVKGTGNGTITDMDGNFLLEVAEGALLEISYIGYLEQEIKVGNQKNLTVRLSEDTQNLD